MAFRSVYLEDDSTLARDAPVLWEVLPIRIVKLETRSLVIVSCFLHSTHRYYLWKVVAQIAPSASSSRQLQERMHNV